MAYNPSDLSSILRTLSSFSANPPPATPATAPAREQTYEPPDHLSRPRPPHQSELNPDTEANPALQPNEPRPSHSQSQSQNANASRPNANANAKNITTWPSALKHIMTLLSSPSSPADSSPVEGPATEGNESIQSRITHLISTQHAHEKTWFEGRQALLRKLADRKRKRVELDAVLYVSLSPSLPCLAMHGATWV